MTTDRHLDLMALMREIENPSKAYYRSVRLASSTHTDSLEWQRAVGRGGQALDAVETAVRAWAAAHPAEEHPAAEFELRGTGEIRAAALVEAADFLRDAHFHEGLSVQEIGTAMRHWADREREADTQQPEPEEVTAVGPRCGNNPNVQLTPGDRKAVDDFKAYLARRRAGGPPERNPFTTEEPTP